MRALHKVKLASLSGGCKQYKCLTTEPKVHEAKNLDSIKGEGDS